MKKGLILLLITIMVFGSSSTSISAPSTDSKVKFDNNIYELKYSALSPETKTYMNEYYKSNETGNNWNELIGVYYFTSYKSPLDYVKDLAALAESQSHLKTQILYNEKEDSAALSFILIGKNKDGSEYIEQNLFKAEKVPHKKGITAIQYAHKYPSNTEKDMEFLKTNITKNQERWLSELVKTPIPALVEKDLRKW